MITSTVVHGIITRHLLSQRVVSLQRFQEFRLFFLSFTQTHLLPVITRGKHKETDERRDRNKSLIVIKLQYFTKRFEFGESRNPTGRQGESKLFFHVASFLTFNIYGFHIVWIRMRHSSAVE